jgi:hypothetical protein
MSGDRFSGLTQGESNLERYPKLKNAAWVIMFALIIITIGYDLLFPSKSIDVSRDQLPITLETRTAAPTNGERRRCIL